MNDKLYQRVTRTIHIGMIHKNCPLVWTQVDFSSNCFHFGPPQISVTTSLCLSFSFARCWLPCWPMPFLTFFGITFSGMDLEPLFFGIDSGMIFFFYYVDAYRFRDAVPPITNPPTHQVRACRAPPLLQIIKSSFLSFFRSS